MCVISKFNFKNKMFIRSKSTLKGLSEEKLWAIDNQQAVTNP